MKCHSALLKEHSWELRETILFCYFSFWRLSWQQIITSCYAVYCKRHLNLSTFPRYEFLAIFHKLWFLLNNITCRKRMPNSFICSAHHSAYSISLMSLLKTKSRQACTLKLKSIFCPWSAFISRNPLTLIWQHFTAVCPAEKVKWNILFISQLMAKICKVCTPECILVPP